jgi:hypothetical protein
MEAKATRSEYDYTDHPPPGFPANTAFADQPRMLKTVNPEHPVDAESNGLQPRLGDFVVTILHNSTAFPRALDWFFDPRVTEFKLLGDFKRDDKTPIETYKIWRKSVKVLVSLGSQELLLRVIDELFSAGSTRTRVTIVLAGGRGPI